MYNVNFPPRCPNCKRTIYPQETAVCEKEVWRHLICPTEEERAIYRAEAQAARFAFEPPFATITPRDVNWQDNPDHFSR